MCKEGGGEEGKGRKEQDMHTMTALKPEGLEVFQMENVQKIVY